MGGEGRGEGGKIVTTLSLLCCVAELEITDRGVKQVAAQNGFGSTDVMRRAFVRLLGITPRRYSEVAGG